MAIIVGTNAYVSLQDFKSWCDLRSYNYGTFTDAEIESAIVIASVDFIDLNFNFNGIKIDIEQPMKLPTSEVSIVNIYNAASQASWQQLNGLLFLPQTKDTYFGEVKRIKSNLKGLEEEIEYTEGSSKGGQFYDISKIKLFLDDFLATHSKGIRSYVV